MLKHRIRVLTLLLLFTVLLWPVALADAACVITGSSGEDDTVICTSTPQDTNGIYTGYGNDTLTIRSDAVVSSPGDAVITYYGDDKVLNYGTVRGGDDAVDLGRGQDTLNNYGLIEATGDAAVMCFPQSGQRCYINNYTAGRINAVYETLDITSMGGDVYIYNTGLIYSQIEEAIHIHNAPFARVNNKGTLEGGAAGIEVYPGVGNITNYGTIIAYHEWAVDTYHSSDIVINYGSGVIRSYAMSAVMTEGGDDTIKNYGTIYTELDVAAQGSISSEDGNDRITTSGAIAEAGVSGIAVEAGYGSDTVTVEGGTIDGLILGDDYGGRRASDYDVLIFRLTSSSQAEMDAFKAALKAQSPAGGSVAWQGQTYRWQGFEKITLYFNGTWVAASYAAVPSTPAAWIETGLWLRS